VYSTTVVGRFIEL